MSSKLEQAFEKRRIDQGKKEIITLNTIQFPKFDEEDEEINKFLVQVGLEILNVGIKAELAVGKKLEEVFERLGNVKSGVYQKFLLSLGINPRTALRQRIRYKFYQKLSTLGYIQAKEIVSIISVAYLEKLNSLCKEHEDEEIILEYLSKSDLTMIEFKEIVDREISSKKEKNPNTEILDSDKVFSIRWKALGKLSKKVEHLPDEKQKEILSYIDKIQLIINENTEEKKEITEAEVI